MIEEDYSTIEIIHADGEMHKYNVKTFKAEVLCDLLFECRDYFYDMCFELGNRKHPIDICCTLGKELSVGKHDVRVKDDES
ncbi:MAG: hypothetical protein V3V61_01050 [Gammaproteobacteria bacterium]